MNKDKLELSFGLSFRLIELIKSLKHISNSIEHMQHNQHWDLVQLGLRAVQLGLNRSGSRECLLSAFHSVSQGWHMETRDDMEMTEMPRGKMRPCTHAQNSQPAFYFLCLHKPQTKLIKDIGPAS